MKQDQAVPTRKKLRGYRHIIDDGVADGHGYFMPQVQPMFLNSGNCATTVADVPRNELLAALEKQSDRRKDRHTRAGQI